MFVFLEYYFIDPFNNENVSPINIRIDLPKGQGPLLPTATLQIQNRSLATTTHALDILAQNLDEIFTPEQKIARRKQPPKILPLDIHLNNLQITLEVMLILFLLDYQKFLSKFSFFMNSQQLMHKLKLNHQQKSILIIYIYYDKVMDK